MFAVKCFNKYLYGHKFVFVTDNQPLRRLLGHQLAVPTLTHDFRDGLWGEFLANADALSMLPITDSTENYIFAYTNIPDIHSKVHDLCKRQLQDKVVSKVIEFTKGVGQIRPQNAV
ncbi:hypothetical protein PR048_002988 [Dryococelus australis]|uniref:Reverse transcriptase RNase H-like domain-containing protein n=1 Tax=Dryococelus australis TaxID=614101 RepID=A0ABQ9IN62_9NEOP|nr:hypothetical protein PR048_002988 [Dryococelus australis]